MAHAVHGSLHGRKKGEALEQCQNRDIVKGGAWFS
jgi:hypothetical protein